MQPSCNGSLWYSYLHTFELTTTSYTAVGAIGVAGLGVVAVFQIANFVASGTGRSMVASPQAVQRSDNDVDVEKKKLLEDSQR